MASNNANNPSPQSQEEAEVASFLAKSSLSAAYDDDVEDGHDGEAPEIMAARQLVQLSGDSGERSTEEEGEEVGPRAAAMTRGGEKASRPCGRRKRKYLPIAVVYAKTRPMPVIDKRRS